MRVSVLVVCVMSMVVSAAVADANPFWDRVKKAGEFVKDAVQGTRDMGRAYTDMRDANWKNSDRYFHARGNNEAASRGSGGRWAAEVISNTRELADRVRGGSAADSARDQKANRWGRNGGDPDRYRPEGLPNQY